MVDVAVWTEVDEGALEGLLAADVGLGGAERLVRRGWAERCGAWGGIEARRWGPVVRAERTSV
jgi:hypothetical protein